MFYFLVCFSSAKSLRLHGSLYLQIDTVVASSEHLGGFFICTHASYYNTSLATPTPFMLPYHCCGEDGFVIAVGNNTMSMLLLQSEMNKHNKK